MLWFDKNLCYVQTCSQILLLLEIMLKYVGILESCAIPKHSLMVAEYLKATRVLFRTLVFFLPLLNNYSIEIINRPHSQDKHEKYADEIP